MKFKKRKKRSNSRGYTLKGVVDHVNKKYAFIEIDEFLVVFGVFLMIFQKNDENERNRRKMKETQENNFLIKTSAGLACTGGQVAGSW